METFGQRIKRLREADGKTQEDIALALKNYNIDAKRTAIAKWEAGTNLPVVSTVMALAHIFGVTSDYLIEGLRTCEFTVKPNEHNIIDTIRRNPCLARLIEISKDMTPEQVKLACRLVSSIIEKDKDHLA